MSLLGCSPWRLAIVAEPGARPALRPFLLRASGNYGVPKRNRPSLNEVRGGRSSRETAQRRWHPTCRSFPERRRFTSPDP